MSGNLGSGKTTFIQGLAEGLGIKERIISPTFILMREHEISLDPVKVLYHLDLYRLEKNEASEVQNLGLFDIWNKPNSIVVIEWAEKIADIIPENRIWITFEDMGEDKRKIQVEK